MVVVRCGPRPNAVGRATACLKARRRSSAGGHPSWDHDVHRRHRDKYTKSEAFRADRRCRYRAVPAECPDYIGTYRLPVVVTSDDTDTLDTTLEYKIDAKNFFTQVSLAKPPTARNTGLIALLNEAVYSHSDD